ncbi:LIC_12616 family protein [Lysinibacillus sp. NPDC092081]|uniref:phage neck terminator protein n=1 Tax=Lysinibacillus sp. NPDC092081 TaxID=3364131 RepID=UPI00382C552D
MNLVKLIRNQLATDTDITIIRADQPGDLPELPYVTYKVIGDRFGVGQEDVSYADFPDALVETRIQERNSTISLNIYGTSYDNAFEVATKLRKWFEYRGFLFLEEINVAIVSMSDIDNRTTFLVDSYDEKWGFDVIIRYLDIDEKEVDYFDKVEVEMKLGR